jgi:hypothetical protein
MGHKLGLQGSYYKPTEKEVLNDYLKAVPSLTINNNDHDQTALKKQVAELTEKGIEETEQTKKELKELKLQNNNNNALLRSVMKTLGELFVKSDNLDPNTLKWFIVDASQYIQFHKCGDVDDADAYMDRLLARREEERMKEKEKSS